MLIVKEGTEQVWKFKDGSIVPISKLSNKQLKECRNSALRSMQKHFDLMNLFTDLSNSLELELNNRIEATKLELDYLVNQDCSEFDN
jgi:hypothetical protein